MKKYFLCLLLAIAIASAVYVAVNHRDTTVQIDARDDNGTVIGGQNPIDELTKVVPPSTVNGGEPFPSEPGEPWLPPEDFLTEEEKEFRQQLIAAAGLDPDDPDSEQKLIAIYSATDSTQFPNARKAPKDPTKGIQSYTDENGAKHEIKNVDQGPGPNANNGVGSYVELTSARAALAGEATI